MNGLLMRYIGGQHAMLFTLTRYGENTIAQCTTDEAIIPALYAEVELLGKNPLCPQIFFPSWNSTFAKRSNISDHLYNSSSTGNACHLFNELLGDGSNVS